MESYPPFNSVVMLEDGRINGSHELEFLFNFGMFHDFVVK